MTETTPAPAPTEPRPGSAASGPPDRTAAQAWPYALAAAAYLAAPFALGAVLPAETATTALLGLLTAGALTLGAIDGVVFRSTWAFPVLTAILALLGLAMYTSDGTWIYALGVLALSRLGGALGGRLRRRR
ncbi:hypothetical protein [Micrococcus sp.]|uniref:hypothetical protein n=1 Tax=Micrococcus sp. TaxID=1271 RepID=UPI0026DBD299|nr:hypothetical protein [Micrococcus sp.]MDO4239030.1 hypothetical protein [Micrococcus sp.]